MPDKKTVRTFNVYGNYIENQTITVQQGGTLNMGTPHKEGTDDQPSAAEAPANAGSQMSVFAQTYVLELTKQQEVMQLLHQLMQSHTRPKQRMLPIRAAIEAMALKSNISHEDFEREFGEINTSSFYRWLKNEYLASEIEPIIALFSSILDGKK